MYSVKYMFQFNNMSRSHTFQQSAVVSPHTYQIVAWLHYVFTL